MKTTSLKTIYLTADELKQAIVKYLEKEHEELAQHLRNNDCEMVWGQDGKEFLVSIDGEIDDDEDILHDRPHKEVGRARAARVVRVKNSTHSYNAGYHRGLNTEYHDVPIEELFAKWIADVRRPASEALDIVAFEKGYNDGKDDYLCGGNTPERVEEQIEWLKKVAEQKEINKMVDEVESAAVKAAHKVMEQHSEAFEKLAENKE